MVRVTNAVASRKRKKRIFKKAKGFVGDRKNHLRITSDAVMRAMAFNFRHRKQNKRNFRSLWIVRIGIAAKLNGISYSKMVNGLKKAGCEINRKMLADLAVRDPACFTEVANTAKVALAS